MGHTSTTKAKQAESRPNEPVTWVDVSDAQLIDIAINTTPKQRLEWLEEALTLGHQIPGSSS